MATKSERRKDADRRSAARGGRRPDDRVGFAPLVLVLGSPQERESECEAILARLRFAVAPATDVGDALRVVDSVHPDLIVAGPHAADRLRREPSISVPIIEFGGEIGDGTALIERIRDAMRVRNRTAP